MCPYSKEELQEIIDGKRDYLKKLLRNKVEPWAEYPRPEYFKICAEYHKQVAEAYLSLGRFENMYFKTYEEHYLK